MVRNLKDVIVEVQAFFQAILASMLSFLEALILAIPKVILLMKGFTESPTGHLARPS